MQKICLIVNPISGGKDKKQLVQTILEHLDHQKYTAEVAWTQRAGHGTELARSADADIVVAVGGDGTVSEVGQGLTGTGKALGIIPCGSGDGLALHLGIPRDPVKAVQILNTGDISPMDMARVNDRPFFCTTGVGFDAVVAWNFAQAGHRGLWTYIREAWKAWWSFQPEHYDLDIDGTHWSGRAFLITVGNCNQWGNQARITPEASVNDGLLDVSIVSPFRLWEIGGLVWRLMTGNAYRCRRVTMLRGRTVTIRREKEGPAHFDGDPCRFGKEISIVLEKAALRVVHPHGKSI